MAHIPQLSHDVFVFKLYIDKYHAFINVTNLKSKIQQPEVSERRLLLALFIL